MACLLGCSDSSVKGGILKVVVLNNIKYIRQINKNLLLLIDFYYILNMWLFKFVEINLSFA